MLEVEWNGRQVALLDEKALYLVKERTLVIADPHFGKAATFRQAGIGIPHGTTAADLERLDRALARTGAQRLVILGDFFHAAQGRSPKTLATIGQWLQARRQLEVVLVRGNHDRHSGDPPAGWSIGCAMPPLVDGDWTYYHMPADANEGCVLAGHIHPAVRLHDPCGTYVRTPCFWFRERTVVLPAFGSFTGTYVVSPAMEDRVFAVGPDAVVELNRKRRPAIRRRS